MTPDRGGRRKEEGGGEIEQRWKKKTDLFSNAVKIELFFYIINLNKTNYVEIFIYCFGLLLFHNFKKSNNTAGSPQKFDICRTEEVVFREQGIFLPKIYEVMLILVWCIWLNENKGSERTFIRGYFETLAILFFFFQILVITMFKSFNLENILTFEQPSFIHISNISLRQISFQLRC